MAATGRNATLVLSATQTDVLISPPRLEIVEGLDALGRASARDLARHLGRSPGAVYHHLTALARAGLIREVERRPGHRRPEAMYALAASTFAIAAGQRTGSTAQAARAAHAVLRQASRDADHAFARDPADLRGRFHGLQLSASLTATEVRQALALLTRLEGLFRRANRAARTGAIYRWTSLFVPVDRSRR